MPLRVVVPVVGSKIDVFCDLSRRLAVDFEVNRTALFWRVINANREVNTIK